MFNYYAAKSITRIIFGISLFIHNFVILMPHQLKVDQKMLEALSEGQKILLATYGLYSFLGKFLFFLGLFTLVYALIKEKGIKRKYSHYLCIYCVIFMILHFFILKVIGF